MAEGGSEVVAYVLKIDAKAAEKNLKSIEKTTGKTADNVETLGKTSKTTKKELDKLGREAKSAATDMSRMAQSTDRATKAQRDLSNQSRRSTKDARAFRRAGRDLDGAFGDLGQGLRLINPSMGDFAIRVSDAASVTEGLGRTATAFLNPAFIATSVLIGGLLIGLELYNKTVGEAAKKQKALAERIKFSNEIIKRQQEIVTNARGQFDDLALALQDVQMQQALFNGTISEQEHLEFKVKNAVEQRRTAQLSNIKDIENGLKFQRMEIQKQILVQAEQGRQATKQQRARLVEIKDELVELHKKEIQLNANAKAIVKEQLALEKARAQRKREQEAEKQRIKAQAKAERERRAAEKKAETDRKKAERDAQKLAKETFKVRKQILKLQDTLASQEALINLELENQINGLNELVKLGVSEAEINELVLLLRQQAAEEIAGLTAKSKEQLKVEKESLKVQEQIVKMRGERIGDVISATTSIATDPVSGLLGTGAQALAASGVTIGGAAAGPIAMAVVEALGAIKSLSEKTPEELEAEALSTTMAIVAGLEMLPEILNNVMPRIINQLTFSLGLVILKMPGLILDAVIRGFYETFQTIKSFFSSGEFRDSLAQGIKDGFTQAGEFLEKVFDPTQRAFMGGGRMVTAQGGIRFTGSEQGLAMLHRNEYVVPQSGQAPQEVHRRLNQGGNSNVVVNVSGTLIERNAIDELVRRLERRFGNFGQGQSSLFGRS